jgi:xanthine dehydrogenase accessory factor
MLRTRDITDEQLARVHAPAGLDLGRVNNSEIAVSVIADLVARRASGQLNAVTPPPARRAAVDPICGMTVDVDDAKYHARIDDVDYYFCAPGCLEAFRSRR